MKIINDTNDTLYYLVTPSGTTLSGSQVIASGWIYPFAAGEVSVPNAGKEPLFTSGEVQPKKTVGRLISAGN